jgi:ectoine hydroxylase-related dioxygenase (phytanoyl-CoA dioxygenase family)
LLEVVRDINPKKMYARAVLTISSGGFDPHIDANAYTHVKNIKHLTILAAVDEMTTENGGLEVVEGSHLQAVPLGSDRCIEPSWVDSHAWIPCDLQPGKLHTSPCHCKKINDLQVTY